MRPRLYRPAETLQLDAKHIVFADRDSQQFIAALGVRRSGSGETRICGIQSNFYPRNRGTAWISHGDQNGASYVSHRRPMHAEKK